ncbi:MAG: three-Cys-motif partner protein TcmP [Chloroflexi bacterium]|nr:three-Cys-motif partner protein TcmP [Chloroflexota bacterium]
MFAVPDDTIWPLEPHTAAKHSILRRYLQAYYPKLASTRGRIDFVDGFAGPGVYSGGEPGSPVIALNALAEHRHLPNMGHCTFAFLFIEQDPPRFQMLKSIVESRQLPRNVEVRVRCGTFEEHIGEAFEGIEFLRDRGLVPGRPTFVMVDPFGVKGLPLSLLRRLARFRKTELLVSLMYEPIIRFLDHPDFEAHLDDLFDTREWRDARGRAADDKKVFLSTLYARQLRSIGMEYVRLFEMKDAGNRTEYFLAFATHSEDGIRAIKEAMWKVDQAGGIVFSDFTAPDPAQATLFEVEPDLEQLQDLLIERFRDQPQVPTEDIDRFVLLETAFRETHGRDVLRKLQREGAGAIEVTRPPSKTKAYWGPGTRVTFLRPE